MHDSAMARDSVPGYLASGWSFAAEGGGSDFQPD